jgi:hypothetical protein
MFNKLLEAVWEPSSAFELSGTILLFGANQQLPTAGRRIRANLHDGAASRKWNHKITGGCQVLPAAIPPQFILLVTKISVPFWVLKVIAGCERIERGGLWVELPLDYRIPSP